MATERDWVGIVAEERCPDCGLCASQVARADLAAAVQEEGRDWGALLHGAAADELRAHRQPGSWSALEYGAHVRDVLGVFRERVALALAEDHPAFGWWDHEAAVVDERYNEQAPTAVAAELELRASRLSSLAVGLDENG
jgi:hypothetical protein